MDVQPVGAATSFQSSVADMPSQVPISQGSTSESSGSKLSSSNAGQPSHGVEIPFENLDGQVPLGSPFYVERPPVEQNCYATIQKPAGLIRIKAPRQMGKTSLMSRVVAEGERLGYRTALINLWDRKFLTDIDTFLENFCATLSDALEIEEKIDQFWKKRLGSQKNCSNYLQKYVLKEITTPIVVGLDEVDRIFAYPQLADDFFALLRSWHELGKNDPVWQKLRLVISHSQEVYIPLNVNRSPFNVGLPIELGEFSRDQLQDLVPRQLYFEGKIPAGFSPHLFPDRVLVQRHGLVWSDTDLTRLIKMIDGHPYLARVALYHIATCSITLEELLKTAPTEAGLYEDHLYRHLLLLEENPRLKKAMLDLVGSDRPLRLEPVVSFKLKSMGLAKSVGNELMPLCDLYRLYFGDRLVD
ncbi:MAG: AAA-like domain-containing protein [Cyanobacteria bacterium P01_F01_bin.150]